MSSGHEDLTEPVARPGATPAPPARRERRSVGAGCFIGAIILALLLGVVGGVLGSILYAASITSKAPISTPKPDNKQALMVQLSNDLITVIAAKRVKDVSVPGTLQNIKVSTPQVGQLQIAGEDQFSIFGLTVTRPFRVVMQPYIDTCKPKMRVLSVDTGGIPVGGLGDSLENVMNSQLSVNLSSLLSGFSYCATGVTTNNSGLVVSYSVTPTS
ncbi:hypothetical protein [Ktedonobacter robiniae]|uniref:Uncharacterized protein n=1 Tax=Ktedonobacter robiniae TaxID=2778365 RepID=A0ABQ3USD3_9CHLR|nr:hypothetical protein [Ktedonobacter robiniae]GHO55701.1 hypothetical protein KSB_41760 [Ktedonobacter robiniae]